MEKQNLLVTIGVPVYNGEEYLSKCIESLVHQTYRNIEIIITNNGSTDNSQQIIEKYANQDKRIKVLTKSKKQHAGPSRTEQCRIAKGTFICFCDADDYLEEDFIETMLSKGATYDLYIADWYKFQNNNTKKEIRKIDFANDFLDREELIELQKKIIGDKNIKTPMDLDLYSSLCGKLYRVSLINDHNIEILSSGDLGGADDALFNVDYLEYAKSGVKINKPLYNYFSNPNSFSHTHKIEDVFKFALQYDEFKKRIIKYKKGDEYKEALNHRIFVQSFGAFIIIYSAKEKKRTKKLVLKKYTNSEDFKNSLCNASYNSFSKGFKPFFKAVAKKHFWVAKSYIKLALFYRNHLR